MCISNTTKARPSPLLQVNSPVDVVLLESQTSEKSSTVPKRRCRHQSNKTAKLFQRHKVIHQYHDHARDYDDDNDDDGSHSSVPTLNQRASFPVKLHQLLAYAESEGLDDIISWQPHGRCFKIHKSSLFIKMILPKFFRQTHLTSFYRQVNLYGFQRLTRGRDQGGYYNEYFLRGKVSLCQQMKRTKVKGTQCKGYTCPEEEPNLYALPSIGAASSSSSSAPNRRTVGNSSLVDKMTTMMMCPTHVDTRSAENLSFCNVLTTIDNRELVCDEKPNHDNLILSESELSLSDDDFDLDEFMDTELLWSSTNNEWDESNNYNDDDPNNNFATTSHVDSNTFVATDEDIVFENTLHNDCTLNFMLECLLVE